MLRYKIPFPRKNVFLTTSILCFMFSVVPDYSLAKCACDDHAYIGNYPKEKSPGWHDNVQGISHDSTNWYITQENRIWKIPAERDLAELVPQYFPAVPLWPICENDAEVPCENIEDTALGSAGYNHFGDLTYYQGYLCVPVEYPGKTENSLLAIFQASNLELVAYSPLPELNGTAGWCAIDSKGYVYLSETNVTELVRYKVNWESIEQEGLRVEIVGKVHLFDEQNNPIELKHMQGGVFSDDGLLYLVNGNETEKCGGCGIHVFEVTSSIRFADGFAPCHTRSTGFCIARRIARSYNGHPAFNYEYHPGWSRYEEAEGITYWDLNAENTPIVPGTTDDGSPIASSQLHVLMLDNDPSDDIYIKHYRVTTERINTNPPTAAERNLIINTE